MAYVVFVFFFPNFLSHSINYVEADPLVTPPHIVPEWYFLPFYAILRSIPNKLGGVVCMALAILVLAILPFSRIKIRSVFHHGNLFYLWFFTTFAICFLLLGYLGGQPIEEPYTFLSQILTFYYFCFFLIFIFFDSVVSGYLYRKK